MRLTERVHAALSEIIELGDLVVDATMGNGHDTLFLSQLVGAEGNVWGLDIQEAALQSTQERLQESPFKNTTLTRASHERMHEHLPSHAIGKIKAVVFNLGYLPRGPKNVTTSSHSTLGALESTHTLLRASGCVHLLCYTGHETGLLEWEVISYWLKENAQEKWHIHQRSEFDESRRPPVWIELIKK